MDFILGLIIMGGSTLFTIWLIRDVYRDRKEEIEAMDDKPSPEVEIVDETVTDAINKLEDDWDISMEDEECSNDGTSGDSDDGDDGDETGSSSKEDEITVEKHDSVSGSGSSEFRDEFKN